MAAPVAHVTYVLHGNDATGKTTLCRLLNSLGHTCFTRGDATKEEAESVDLAAIDSYTLRVPSDDRPELKTSHTHAGNEHKIVRVVLDADLPTLLARIAKRNTQPADKWESEKALFYYRARFRELATFYGLPVVRTDGEKSLDDTAKEIVALANNTPLLNALNQLSLRNLTLEKVRELEIGSRKIDGIDYEKELQEIVAKECSSPTSLFTSEDVHSQCAKDPKLIYALVNSCHDISHDQADEGRGFYLKLIVEGESKQVYRVCSSNSAIAAYFAPVFYILLKPTIYSHSRQSTAEIPELSSIRAHGSRLFLEMLHRAGVEHTYLSLNAHGIVCARDTATTPIEICYKAYCEGTDKHSFYHYRLLKEAVSQETGEYLVGPYIRFDWRNPNHTFKGVDVSTHPFYHIMEASIGKEEYYSRFLTGGERGAVPMGDKCVPVTLVHPMQDVERSRSLAMKTYLTIRWYLNQLGLEVQDGCVLIDRHGNEAWSEINQDCMRIKRISSDGQEAFDKDVWRAGGSSAKDKIQTKWIQLNDLLSEYLTSKPFHENEMVSPDEPYGLISRKILADERFGPMPQDYNALYTTLASHRRIPAQSKSTYTVGITGTAKYTNKSDEFVLSCLGVELVRPSGSSRSLKYEHKVVDQSKYEQCFGAQSTIRFVPMKPKDMPAALRKGQLDFAVAYSSAMDQSTPGSGIKVPALSSFVRDTDIMLALICRKGSNIDPATQWSPTNKAQLIVEHPNIISTFLTSLGIPENHYVLEKVLGSSESYLVNTEAERYVLCDAVVSSGKTLEDNGLEIWKVVKEKGECTVGLYKACKYVV